jgi:hypothetical protein
MITSKPIELGKASEETKGIGVLQGDNYMEPFGANPL